MSDVPARSRFTGAVVISAVVILANITLLGFVLSRVVPDSQHDIVMYAIGSFGAMTGAVVQYWVGTSNNKTI